MIEAIELTSTRRSRVAGGGPVENVSFDVYPGQVTALLGAPGAGKSTVLRLMVELEPGGGRTLFGGRPYRALRPAVREVGLALNPDAVHPGRTVQAHLQLYAAAGGVPKPRVAEVLEVAGLSTQATVRCGRLDAGQRQRLSIAAALLGDPAALILDEPLALDAHGMSWFHALIRAYAAQGRTVLVAATDPDTLSGTADHVIVLRRDEHDGISRVIASRSAAEVFDEHRVTVVQVRSPQAARLAAALESEGARLAPAGPGALQVRGMDRARIGEVAHIAGVCLHELSEIDHDDDVFGLRPVPRQKELLPSLNRAGGIWRSGVRVVSDEIEEAELVDAATEASTEASTEAEHPDIAAEAEARSAQDVPEAAVPAAVQASPVAATAVGAHAAEATVPVTVQASPATATAVGAQPSETAVGARPAQPSAMAQAPEATVGAQALESAIEARTAQPSLAAQAPQSSVGAETPEPSQAVGAADAQSLQATDQQAAGMKPSWRTQGSVAGSRWSAVKGSQAQQGSAVAPTAQLSASTPAPTTPEPDSAATTAIPSLAAADKPAAAAAPNSDPVAPLKSAEVTRRTSGFGLRWGRGKPQPSAVPTPSPAPEKVASPVLVQPAVPFTVAPPAAEHRGAADGMTPWRAAAARASKQKQSQQQATVAEAAPAEQEASA